MAAITIHNLPDEAHRALKARAAANGRSAEAEIRAILTESVLPPDRIKAGSAMVELFRPYGGVDLDIERDRTPPRAVDFD